MMTKNEYRIGNWVCYTEMTGEEWELYISAMTEESVELSSRHAVYLRNPWEQVSPLRMFYWHLEYAGFEKLAKDVYACNGWVVDLNTATVTWQEQVFTGIRNVHELQNLVFDRSGWDIDFHLMSDEE